MMETFLYPLLAMFFVIGWTYLVYSAGHLSGSRQRRQIEEAIRNSGKHQNHAANNR
jgi:hypothetical protein